MNFLASGTIDGETFTATSANDEVCIRVHKNTPDGLPGRGQLLAEALGARPAANSTHYLTPARAAKWHTLFAAGFTARRRNNKWGNREWIFVRDGRDYARHDAVKAARTVAV